MPEPIETIVGRAVAPAITLDQSDEFVKIVECGKGKVVDWTDQKQILATKRIDRCFILALTDKKRGLLFHFQISSMKKCMEQFLGLLKWATENEHVFRSARLFFIRPNMEIDENEYEVAQSLTESLVRSMKLRPRLIYNDDIEEKRVTPGRVELYSDGAGGFPIVRCNGAQIAPVAPSFHNAR